MNPHGFAVYEIETGTLTKTFDKEQAKKLLSQAKPFIAHCRWKTQGEITKENIHLFEMGDWLVAMNGTIGGLKDKDTNDTIQMIKMINQHIKKEKLLEFLNMWEARFLLYNRKTKKCIKTGTWIENDKVHYSKDNVLEEKKTYKNSVSGVGQSANHHNSVATTVLTSHSDVNYIFDQTENFVHYEKDTDDWYFSVPENLDPIFIDKITGEKLGFAIKDYVEEDDENELVVATTTMPYKYASKNKKGRLKPSGICNIINFDGELISGNLYYISAYNLSLLETRLNGGKKYTINNLYVTTKDDNEAIYSNCIFAI